MDLSIFEQVFALRDEARKAQLSADAPDASDLRPGEENGKVVQPPNLPHEKLAAELMTRAVELRWQATKSESTKDHPSRTAITELLHAASVRLPAFEESDLAAGRTAPSDKGR